MLKLLGLQSQIREILQTVWEREGEKKKNKKPRTTTKTTTDLEECRNLTRAVKKGRRDVRGG